MRGLSSVSDAWGPGDPSPWAVLFIHTSVPKDERRLLLPSALTGSLRIVRHPPTHPATGSGSGSHAPEVVGVSHSSLSRLRARSCLA